MAVDTPPGATSSHRDAGSVRRWVRVLLMATAAVDLLVLSYAVLLAWNLRWNVDIWSSSAPVSPLSRSGPLLVLGWFAVLAAQGAYSRRTFGGGPDEYRVVTTASVIAGGVVGMTCYLFQLPLSRGFVVLSFLLGTPLLLLGRLVVRRVTSELRRGGRMVHRVIAIGGPSGTCEVHDSLSRERQAGYQLVGACVPAGVAVEPARFPVPILGSVADARRLCDEVGADTVLVTRGGYGSAQELRRIAWDLEGSSIDLVVVPSVTDVAGPRIHMRPVAGLPLLHVEQPQAGEAGGMSKRVFDVVGALTALVLLSPVMLAVAALIRLEDRGGVLFVQPRIGRDGRTFGCYKFRSMFVDAERMEQRLRERAGHAGALFKMKDDPRITRVGAFLRRYSVDELPQLVNVVRGEMSLVGPRPQQSWEVETYTDWEHRRLRVRPGMTGLWQVSGRSQLSFDEAIRLDLYYVDNWSLTSDLVIMARTVQAVVGKAGAY